MALVHDKTNRFALISAMSLGFNLFIASSLMLPYLLDGGETMSVSDGEMLFSASVHKEYPCSR